MFSFSFAAIFYCPLQQAVKQAVRASNLSLYSGDAYIVLLTTQKPDSSELEWALHFWLGADSTQGRLPFLSTNVVQNCS